MFIMVVIVLSSMALATEDPVDEKSQRNKYLNHLDHCFTGVFAVEMILKVRHVRFEDDEPPFFFSFVADFFFFSNL